MALGFGLDMGRGARAGAAGRATSVWRALAALSLCAAFAVLALSPSFARADEASGYLTVQGVEGVDEAAAYATLPEALAAVSGDGDLSATIVVHGSVSLGGSDDGSSLVWEIGDGQGSSCALIGADEQARIVAGPEGSGASATFSNSAGSLVVRGISFAGDVSFAAKGDIAVDSCSFDGQVRCVSAGSVAVSGNAFSSTAAGCALTVDLGEGVGTLSVTGNQVSGYACGVEVACAAAADSCPSVGITSNSFALADDGSGAPTAALRLSGGPWPSPAVVCDGNTVAGADALVMLGATFSMRSGGQQGDGVQAASDGTLLADAVVSLFELVAGDVSGLASETAAVCVDASIAGTPVAEEVSRASSLLKPPAAVGPSSVEGSPSEAAEPRSAEAAEPQGAAAAEPAPSATVTVTYDANGASGGEPPASVSVELGSSVTAENMGTLVYAGFVFEGWNTQADGEGTFYAAGQVFAPQADITLYAQWAPTGTVATVDVASVPADPTAQSADSDGADA